MTCASVARRSHTGSTTSDYAIYLEHISEAPARARPQRIEARTLQIANPPVAVSVGMREIGIGGVIYTTQLFGRIFDFGVVSLRLEIAGADTTTWGAFVDFARSLEVSRALDSVFCTRARGTARADCARRGAGGCCAGS